MAFNEKIKKTSTSRGVSPLTKTVRLRPEGNKRITITMSSDILPRIPANIGSHIEVIRGTGDDFGSFLLSATKPSNDSFKIGRRGESSLCSGIITVSVSQLFDLQIPKGHYIDCPLSFAAEGIICQIPAIKSRQFFVKAV